MYQVLVTHKAAEDLSLAARYIALNLSNKVAAKRLLDEFDELVEKLQDVAGVYPFVRDELAAAAGYRWAEIGNYMVFFHIDELEKQVFIDRIAYKKRNWLALIK